MKIKPIILLLACLLIGKTPFRGLGAYAQNFTGSYTMHTEDSARKKTVDLKITFKKEKSCLEIITGENAGKFRTIFDSKERTMTILTEKEGASKLAMIRSMPDITESSEPAAKDVKITLTDETKTIENYSCKKVMVESADAITEMWITQDLNISYDDMVTILNHGAGPISGMIQNIKNYKSLKGFPLKMTVANKIKAGEVINITITNVLLNTVDNSVFNTNGYQVMDVRNAGSR
ncbi:MAG: DUF4412 domain-containing protein [Bacteroidia bacterium]